MCFITLKTMTALMSGAYAILIGVVIQKKSNSSVKRPVSKSGGMAAKTSGLRFVPAAELGLRMLA